MKTLLLGLLSILFVSCGSSTSSSYAEHRARQKSILTDGGKLAYSDQGQGEAIVLLHGVPTSSWLYRKVIPGLRKKHRVIAIDLIGYGSSTKPANNGIVYSPASQARRVRKLMRVLKIKRYSIMMHDMGGLVAWEMMRQDQAAVKNLIVLNTIVRQEGFNAPNLRPGFLTETLAKAYSNRLTSETILGMTFRNLGLKSARKLSEAECQGYVLPMREGSDRALYAFFTNLDTNLFANLERNKTMFQNFTGRTLVLWGARDKTLTTAQIPFLTKHLRIPKKDVHIYSGNDHFLVEEIPGEVVKQVNRFLRSSDL